MKIVISGGHVIDPASSLDEKRDVIVEDGVIKDIVRAGDAPKDGEQIDAKGKWVTPGLIDLHVHLREPGYEWKETIQTGCEAASLGGFTSICSMPNTSPTNDSHEVTEFILEKAKRTGLSRVLPIGAVSIGLKGKEMAPLSELRHAGCVAFSDDGEPIYDAGLMRRALEWCRMLDAVISCHEEDKSLSCSGCMNESGRSSRMGLLGMPTVAEDVMVARDIELARYTGGRVHICHVSTGRGVELIRRAKNDGIRVTAEVTPHHLTLTEEAIESYNAQAKMSPPLRELSDVEALRIGLKDGTIDAVASDHAPHENDRKECEFSLAAFGILGLQTSLPLLLEFVRKGTISRLRAIEAFTLSPARAFGLPYGTLKKGAPADLVLIDPDHSWRFSRESVKSVSFNSPFLDQEMKGRADTVIIGGKVAVLSGKLRS